MISPKAFAPPLSAASASRSVSGATAYEILRIPVGASGKEIKAAYRSLARVCHPDAAAIDRRDSSADEFMNIHAAYCTLSDPEKRAVYDRKVYRRGKPVTAVAGFSGRNWETDQCWYRLCN